jgi:hypothetical protein
MYGDVPEKIQEEIREHYQAGRGSIQDYARIYHLTVPQVLEIVNEKDLGEVTVSHGDQIDADEIGRNNAGEIQGPRKEDTPFSLN